MTPYAGQVIWTLASLFSLGLTLAVIPMAVAKLWGSHNRWLSIYLAIIGLTAITSHVADTTKLVLSLAQ